MTGGLTLPPLFSTSEPESFALRSIRDRHAFSLLSVIEENGLEEPYRSRLLTFRKEALGGALTDPFVQDGWDPSLFQPQELADWRRELDPRVGRSWYDLPWYFAEAFFFLALLFAFGYYEPGGPHRLQDPFAPLKRRELASAGGLDAASSLAALPAGAAPSAEALRELLLASLWGNRVDLSMQRLAGSYRRSFLRYEARELLTDQSAAVAQKLRAARRVDFILDNSGPELVCDLLLASWLLRQDPQRQVVLHAKHCPFYVSDATASDVRTAVEALAASPQAPVRQTAGNLDRELAQGRLALREHWFWNGPLFFSEMPAELHQEMAESDLVLIKGDANYRRLVGDRRWPPETRMESLTGYFPAPIAALRTLKSELVLDLEPGQAERLDQEDLEWRTNGRRGIIRLVEAA
jgi:hypothetical protein